MKRSEYKNMLNKIKCSKEFNDKMENILSSEVFEQHEYADMVSDIETAPKNNIRRVMTSLAACLVVCGVCGGIYYSVKNTPIDSGTESSQSKYDTLPFGDITKMKVSVSYFEDSFLGEEKVQQIAEYLNTLDWKQADYTSAEGAEQSYVLYLDNGKTTSSLRFNDNGCVEWFGTDEDGLDFHSYYDLDSEIFGSVQAIILTGSIVSEDTTETPDYADGLFPGGDISGKHVEAKIGELDCKPVSMMQVDEIDVILNAKKWIPEDDAVLPDDIEYIVTLFIADESIVKIALNGAAQYTDLKNDETYTYTIDVSTFLSLNEILKVDNLNALMLIENEFPTNDNMSLIYMADGGQLTPAIEFKFARSAEFKEMLLGFEWEKISLDELELQENFYKDFYMIGNLLVNEAGYMMDTSTRDMFRVKGDVSYQIAEFLRSERSKDNIADLQYRVFFADDSYTTMTADIKAYYTIEEHQKDGNSESYSKYTVDSSGKLWCDNQKYLHYIDVEGETTNGENIKTECMYVNDDVIYVEHGENIDKLDNTRSFFLDANGVQTSYDIYEYVSFCGESAALDYFYLDNRIMQDIYNYKDIEASSFYSSNQEHYEEEIDGITYQVYNFVNEPLKGTVGEPWSLEIHLDERGNVVKYIKNQGEVCTIFELSNIRYDAEDFEMHEFTTEEVAYSNFTCEELAEHQDDILMLDYCSGSITKYKNSISDVEHKEIVKSEFQRIINNFEPIDIDPDEIGIQHSYSRFMYRENGKYEEFFVYPLIYPDNPEMEPEKPYNFRYKDNYYLLDNSELEQLNQVRNIYYEDSVETDLNEFDHIDISE